MADQTTNLDPYLAEHLHEALASDPRVNEIGIEVGIEGETLVLRGTLTSAEQQEAVARVAREMAPRFAIRNETVVKDLTEPAQTEVIP